MVADELRRQADAFIDLAELRATIGRDPSERPPARDIRQQLPPFATRGAINGGSIAE
jgi:hypothetical protein